VDTSDVKFIVNTGEGSKVFKSVYKLIVFCKKGGVFMVSYIQNFKIFGYDKSEVIEIHFKFN
jgi:hypothetical protein